MSDNVHIDFDTFFEQFSDAYGDDISIGGSILCDMIGVSHHVNDEAGIADDGENFCIYFKRGSTTYVFGETADIFPNCRSDGAQFSVATIQADTSWELIDEADSRFIEKHPMSNIEDVIAWLRKTIS